MPEPNRSRFTSGRHAGVMVPLFSIPSGMSWGIGEIPDLALFSRWLESSGLAFVQLLPVNEMADGQNSPYSAMSAMAVDPIFIGLRDVQDFVEAGGEATLPSDERTDLEAARQSSAVDYPVVRRIKSHALRLAFDSFRLRHWQSGSGRADALRRYSEREGWWLNDYALFRALHDERDLRSWVEWTPDLRDREPAALAAARERLAGPILFYAYLQWLADEQWQRARRECAPAGIFGDFPFMVSANSADVWARQREFRVDVSVGVPPDAFSETGQDWGLPAYRWDVVSRNGYQWLRDRTRRCAELFDGFRVDHLVGFYRTFVKEADGSTCFVPADEHDQRIQGERLLTLFASHGAAILAEDLGTVPDFVRASMERLAVPGMKVLRWEREWQQPGRPFRDPACYPAKSVATTGTHDTEAMAEWWDASDDDERRAVTSLPLLRERGTPPDRPFSDATRDALLEALFAAGSDLLILPLQDIFGWRDRINRPASVGNENWTWRLPTTVEDLMTAPGPSARASFLRRLSREYGRF